MQVTWSGNEVDDHELYDSYESKDKNNLVVFAAFITNSNYDPSKKINQNDKNKFDFFLFLFYIIFMLPIMQENLKIKDESIKMSRKAIKIKEFNDALKNENANPLNE